MSEPPRTGEHQGPPMVYQPQPEHIPAYEEYADPAAAHGWQNTYDETRELPPLTAPGPRRSRRKPSPWRQRRAAGVAVAVGAVSAAALIAGFSLSGSSTSGGGAQSEKDRTSPTAGDPGAGTPSGADRDTRKAGTLPEAGQAATRTTPTPGSTPSPGTPESSGPGSAAPSTSATSAPSLTTTPPATPAPTSATPTTSPVPDDAPGNANGNPGHGQGGTKRPK